jgi:thioredoxin-related protein
VKRLLFLFILIPIVPLLVYSGDEPAVDMSKVVTDTNALPVNLTAEIARANREHKLLLLEFGSSDACPPCIRFEQQVFSTPQFKAFAQSNLDLVHLDFPLKSDLRPDTVATNTLLSQQFDAYGFPTFVALDRNGKELWKMPKDGMDPDFEPLFQPTNFINLIVQLKQKEQ